MSGRVGNLSDKQAEKLAKFKEALKDVLQEKHDDIYLLRFLRARQFNMKKSEQMFRKDFEWRQDMEVEKIRNEFVPPEVLTKYFGGGIIGPDRHGSIVWIDPFGHRDVKGLMYSCKNSDLIKFDIMVQEEFLAQTVDQNKKLGKDVGGIVLIGDLDGFGGSYFWKPYLDYMKKKINMMEQHYPEMMKLIIMINAPKLFMILYNMWTRHALRSLRKKIIILGSDWKTELPKYIDANILPAHWGGNRVDPDGDPECPSVVNPGGSVPKSYYLKDCTKIAENNLTTREVARGAKLEFKYQVMKPGSVLSYEFKTKQADIAFSLKRIGSDGKRVTVIKKQRYNCHIIPVDGQETLDEPGTYILKFDNSYSLMRPKTLSYFVELLEPLDEDDEEEEDIEFFNAHE